MSCTVEVIAAGADELGEGPVWLAAEAALLRVDIAAGTVVVRDGAGRERRRALGPPVGFALPAAGGELVAGVGRTVVRLAGLDAPARRHAAVDPADGMPDGLCVDAEGGVWVALFGGGALRRYDPRGRVDVHIALPVSHPTCPAFGGPGLRELYVTSARARARAPLDGSLLRLRPGVSGRPATPFGGG